MGNAFIQFNKFANATGVLGEVSFKAFAEAVTSSANALAIATAKGKTFTDNMTKDLMSLSGLATSLGLSISEINGMFEQAGSMIMSPESPFRAFLAISGGANITQMLSNQFDKTDAMLKGITFLQNFNKSFGGNIMLTAQVAAQQLGISKEMAITMINTKQKMIDDMIKGQRELATIQTDATKEAFEKVNGDLSSLWNRVKTMFITMFQNVISGSDGMQNLIQRVEGLLSNFRGWMESSGFLKRLKDFVERITDWLANNVNDMLDKVISIAESLADGTFWDKGLSNLGSLLWKILKTPFQLLGGVIAFGMREALKDTWIGDNLLDSGKAGAQAALFMKDADKRMGIGDVAGTGLSTNSTISQIDKDKQRRLGEINRQESELSKWSPDTVTYGRSASGEVGYMTVGQKEFALEEEKKKLQEQMADDIHTTAKGITILVQQSQSGEYKSDYARENMRAQNVSVIAEPDLLVSDGKGYSSYPAWKAPWKK